MNTPQDLSTNSSLLAHALAGRASDRQRVFLATADGRRWSYADLDRETARMAALLAARGARPGDRVAAQLDKSPGALLLYLACLRGGLVHLPLNTAYPGEELAFFLADARPVLAVVRPQAESLFQELLPAGSQGVLTLDADGRGSFADGLEHAGGMAILPRAAADLAALVYTSGTTGRPKGAMLTHGNLLSNGRTLVEAWGFTDSDTLLHALPLFHVHGLFVAVHCALLSGSGILLLPRFDTGAVIDELPRCSVLMGVPTFYTRLLAEPRFGVDTCATMRLFISGSAPLLERTFEEFRTRTGHTILERYGMTETQMNTSNPLRGQRRAGTVGSALPGITVRVADREDRPVPAGATGEIQIQGPNVFAGYWGLPAQTAREFTADGYFRSGDLGRYDNDGYLSIVGRARDLVISGGYNVYPKEIELRLDQIDGVRESAVIGVPHADLGEAVTAVVVREPGRSDVTEATILAALAGRVAGYKIPRRIHFEPDLPRNAMGKVQKNLLRARFAGQ